MDIAWFLLLIGTIVSFALGFKLGESAANDWWQKNLRRK